ncbi:hypothetical protein MMC17_000897 [Xylographa soralifera]|nr:hypothetical protein [Xylographa soralifera]
MPALTSNDSHPEAPFASVVLITGANRGIGRGLVEEYLSRPNSTVVAAVRDPSNATSQSLSTIAIAKGSKLITVKIDSLSETDAKAAVELLKESHGISKLDVVIANSGIGKYFGQAGETPISELRDHLDVNYIGTLVLFQATLPLLEASADPKFVLVSSFLGSLSDMEKYPLPVLSYGASKAAANYMIRKIHFEYPKLTVFSMSPGWVQTEMGNGAAEHVGMNEAPHTIQQSCQGIQSQIDEATKEKSSGMFLSFDGTTVPW